MSCWIWKGVGLLLPYFDLYLLQCLHGPCHYPALTTNNIKVIIMLQRTAGLWGLMTPTRGETGAGNRSMGLKGWSRTCSAPSEKRGPLRDCRSASKACAAETEGTVRSWTHHLSFMFAYTLTKEFCRTIMYYLNAPDKQIQNTSSTVDAEPIFHRPVE